MRSAPVFTALLFSLGCHPAKAGPPTPVAGTRTTAAPAVAEPIFQGGLQADWQDHGWCERQPRKRGEPERLLLSNYGGWILHNSTVRGIHGGLVFRFRAPAAFGDFLQVRVDSETADIFPRIDVAPRHRRDLGDGWSEVFVSMLEINPTLAPFNQVVLRARVSLPAPGLVEVDGVALTTADADLAAKAQSLPTGPATPAAMVVDCTAAPKPISPLIYGIAFSPLREYTADHQWKVNATARRWGGNPTSRFNWELGAAWNTGSDYFFENVDYVRRADFTWATFLEVDRDRRLQTALTVPMLGWVAKNTKSVGFPVEDFGVQQQVDGDRGAGNGIARDGKPLRPGNPTQTSVVAPPEFIGRWVSAIKKLEAERGRVVHQYILDNEPGLWHDTHRDVHPTPLTYDELLDRTLRYGTAIRQADPEALIAGPAEWGWTGYLYSAADAVAGFRAKPDRRAHGDVPLIEWYLTKLAEHEKKTGVRVLDVLDLHYYPQGKGIGVGADGQTDRDTNALRIRSTRSLWDPKYADESWIKEPVQLIPRMRGWVDQFYPGLKLSIGEYNFGAERHLSGGLALAEALGRFGQQGLYSAFYWTYPPENSPAFYAFRAFRNFDGQGATFQPLSLPAEAPRDTSLFASRSADWHTVTLVLLNFSPTAGFDASVNLKGCQTALAQRVFTFTGDPRGFVERATPVGKAYRLPPYSITVVEQQLPKPPKQ